MPLQTIHFCRFFAALLIFLPILVTYLYLFITVSPVVNVMGRTTANISNTKLETYANARTKLIRRNSKWRIIEIYTSACLLGSLASIASRDALTMIYNHRVMCAQRNCFAQTSSLDHIKNLMHYKSVSRNIRRVLINIQSSRVPRCTEFPLQHAENLHYGCIILAKIIWEEVE